MTAHASDRLGRIPDDRLTAEQRAAIETYTTTRKERDISGPWVPLLRSPEILVRTQALGEYLRYKTVFPPRLSELIILLTARHWSQQYEWGLHCPIAIAAGVDRSIADAIAEGRRPERMSEEQEIAVRLLHGAAPQQVRERSDLRAGACDVRRHRRRRGGQHRRLLRDARGHPEHGQDARRAGYACARAAPAVKQPAAGSRRLAGSRRARLGRAEAAGRLKPAPTGECDDWLPAAAVSRGAVRRRR